MRVRIRFSKSGPLRYIGNLDLQTIWERAARRADLPLSYSHGFHPQPKIQIASPLPLGYSSRCEVVDLRLDAAVELGSLRERVQAAMPEGIRILGAEPVGLDAPALQTILVSAEYQVTLAPAVDAHDLAERVIALRDSATLPRERRGKAYDLRPLIEDLKLEMDKSDGAPCLHLRLSAREGATGRPDEVLAELNVSMDDARIERTSLIFHT